MKIERFRQIVEAYGVNPRRWPPDERESAEYCLDSSQEASRFISEYALLDEKLDSYLMSVPAELENRILENILEQSGDWLSDLMEWLMPSTEQFTFLIWRPALVVSVLFCAGIFIGINTGSDTQGDPDNITLMWEDEAYWIALSGESEQ